MKQEVTLQPIPTSAIVPESEMLIVLAVMEKHRKLAVERQCQVEPVPLAFDILVALKKAAS